MSNITINAANHTIEMNKTFSKAASKYGTPEYIELQNARRDYPDFRTVTVAKKGAKPEYKGLTYACWFLQGHLERNRQPQGGHHRVEKASR